MPPLPSSQAASHSYHQILSEDMNEPVPSFLADGSAYYPPGSSNANPNLANTTSWVSHGVGMYHAAIVDLRRSYGNGLQFRANYTYATNLDNGTAWNTSVSVNSPAFVMFPLREKLDWGPAATDIRQMAAAHGSYELPVGRGRRYLKRLPYPLEAALGAWTVSAIFNTQSGFPFTPQLAYNPTGNGDTRNPVRPDWNKNFTGQLYPHSPAQWFRPDAFSAPSPGTFGNVRRNALWGPGMTNMDMSAAKIVPCGERMRLQLRAEFFNIANHTNFATPNPVVFTAATSGISPTAGLITATATTSRQIQFGARLQF